MRPKRKFLPRWTLRSQFIAIASFAVVLCIGRAWYQATMLQREGRIALRGAADLMFDDEYNIQEDLADAEEPQPIRHNYYRSQVDRADWFHSIIYAWFLRQPKSFSDLAKLPHLKCLKAGETLNDAESIHLLSVPELQVLDLVFNKNVSDEGMANIGRLNDLRSFSAPENITDEGLAHLMSLRKLKILRLEHSSKISGQTLGRLECKHSLAMLRLGVGVKDESLDQLVAFDHLQSLFVASPVSDRAVDALSKHRNLNDVTLADASQLTAKGLSQLASLKSLRRLDLFGVRPEAVIGLSSCSQLETLYIGAPDLHDSDLAPLASLTGLRKLHLGCEPFTKQGLGWLPRLSQLQVLNLNPFYPAPTDEILDLFLEMRSLREVSFSTENITPAALEQFQTFLPDMKINP